MLPLKSLFQGGGNLMYFTPPSPSPFISLCDMHCNPIHGVTPDPPSFPPPSLTCIFAYKKAQGPVSNFSYPLLLALCFEGSLTPEISLLERSQSFVLVYKSY